MTSDERWACLARLRPFDATRWWDRYLGRRWAEQETEFYAEVAEQMRAGGF